jgi:hypothetical protein
MPVAAAFLSEFGFITNKDYGGFTLTHVTSSHVAIKQYHEYRYDIVLQFIGSASYDHLGTILIPLITAEHVIYGVRNPYRCTIDFPREGDIMYDGTETYTVKLTGHSYRVYH